MCSRQLDAALAPISAFRRQRNVSALRIVCREASPGQAAVEAALGILLLVLLLTAAVSVGQFISYDVGLSNAAAAAASAAAAQAASGSSGNPSQGAVSAINQEQNVTSWIACGSPVTAPCVSVSSASQNTGSGTSVNVEEVVLHGTFTPPFNILGLSFPVTINAAAGS